MEPMKTPIFFGKRLCLQPHQDFRIVTQVILVDMFAPGSRYAEMYRRTRGFDLVKLRCDWRLGNESYQGWVGLGGA